MSPRKYRMGARAEAVEATRARIVAAAMGLHIERGVQVTSWEEIAREAGVSTATVYRHFPSLAELIPACARNVFDVIEPPRIEDVRPQFAEFKDASGRFEHLIHENMHCYGAGAGWLHAAYRERDFVPELDDALLVIEDSLRVLVAAAAGGRLAKQPAAALFVLCNFPFYRQLKSSGLSDRATEDLLVRMVNDELSRARIK